MARSLPMSYLVLASTLLVAAIFTVLVYFGVPPFDNLALFVLTNAVGAFMLIVGGVLGGAFVGMLLAHRMLANRQFSPFERTVLEGIEEIRARLDKLEANASEKRETELRR